MRKRIPELETITIMTICLRSLMSVECSTLTPSNPSIFSLYSAPFLTSSFSTTSPSTLSGSFKLSFSSLEDWLIDWLWFKDNAFCSMIGWTKPLFSLIGRAKSSVKPRGDNSFLDCEVASLDCEAKGSRSVWIKVLELDPIKRLDLTVSSLRNFSLKLLILLFLTQKLYQSQINWYDFVNKFDTKQCQIWNWFFNVLHFTKLLIFLSVPFLHQRNCRLTMVPLFSNLKTL